MKKNHPGFGVFLGILGIIFIIFGPIILMMGLVTFFVVRVPLLPSYIITFFLLGYAVGAVKCDKGAYIVFFVIIEAWILFIQPLSLLYFLIVNVSSATGFPIGYYLWEKIKVF